MRRLRPSLLLALSLFIVGGWACTWFGHSFARQFCGAALGLGH
ncbi:MAG TPA: hypothetical protein VJ623_09390 [Holophagaceae bacterium]|nr:hypothetical protein [Holophagaceae bacterium]HJW32274.1 hypothetical protein [Holophagaceae bacterium]